MEQKTKIVALLLSIVMSLSALPLMPAMGAVREASDLAVTQAETTTPGSVAATATASEESATPGQLDLYTPAFTDVPQNAWFYREVSALASEGTVKGYPDGLFRPGEPVARAEMAATLSRAKGLRSTGSEPFDDVRGADWFYADVTAVYGAVLMSGTSKSAFSPNQPLTREQAATVMVRVAGVAPIDGPEEQGLWLQGFKDRHQISEWSRPYVAAAVKYGLVTGYPNQRFKAKAPVSRAEASVLLWRLQNGSLAPQSAYPSYVAPYPAEPRVTGPRAGTVVYGARFTLTAAVDPESTTQELWINGRLSATRQTSEASSVDFADVRLPSQTNSIAVVSRNASGSTRSSAVTLYYFSAPSSYKRLIVVDLSEFRLYWIVDGMVKRAYPIAIGKDATVTPIAKWIVGQKHVENPSGVFGPRRLRLYRLVAGNYKYTGYGIHGTNQPWVIGTQASHGCIRLYNKDILELWPQVSVGDHVITQR